VSNAPSIVTLDKIVALCKRRGFVYPAADIYGGLNGVYDFGPLGAQLRTNIRNAWTRAMDEAPSEIVFFDGALLGHHKMWEASGHVENFHDPMVDCLNCKKRFRADDPDINLEKSCPSCGIKKWTEIRQFNMMFKTELGASSEHTSIAYLRPETAQPIFINFKNIISTNRVKIPFGVAQIGKAFRNEITPKQFLFRMREFEQMEVEWFCKEEHVEQGFPAWIEARRKFYVSIGITESRLRFYQQQKHERAHYSTQCTDIEYLFPFGWKELEGIAHRGTYDLTQHSQHSGKDLSVFDEETKTSYTPHVIECSVGVDRLFLTLLFDAYHEDIIDGEERVVLKLHPRVAPVKAAFLSLTKKLNDQTHAIYTRIKKAGYAVQFDDAGSIGKRYRRQDEIGTPLCFTYDFDSIEDNCVTVRDRDTTQQKRISIDQIEDYLRAQLD